MMGSKPLLRVRMPSIRFFPKSSLQYSPTRRKSGNSW